MPPQCWFFPPKSLIQIFLIFLSTTKWLFIKCTFFSFKQINSKLCIPQTKTNIRTNTIKWGSKQKTILPHLILCKKLYDEVLRHVCWECFVNNKRVFVSPLTPYTLEMWLGDIYWACALLSLLILCLYQTKEKGNSHFCLMFFSDVNVMWASETLR